MKYLIPFLAVFIFNTAVVEKTHALDVYAMGSYWDMDDADEVVGGAVGVAAPIILDNIKLDARIYFFEDTEFESESIELLPIDVGLQIHLLDDGDVNPYVLGGLSFIYADADDIDVDSEFGGYVGAGIEFKVGEIRLFGEGIYRIASIDKDTNLLEDDLDLNGLLINAGIKVRF